VLIVILNGKQMNVNKYELYKIENNWF
jgi:hypothetical protein